jgi:hypothetical protein
MTLVNIHPNLLTLLRFVQPLTGPNSLIFSRVLALKTTGYPSLFGMGASVTPADIVVGQNSEHTISHAAWLPPGSFTVRVAEQPPAAAKNPVPS